MNLCKFLGCLLAASCFQRLPRNTFGLHTRLARGVDKVRLQVLERSQQDTILLVDGNNVRGMGKFEWSQFKLQQKVASFCCSYNISKAVVVWDHGAFPYACTRKVKMSSPYYSSQELDMFILFSGLGRRADDVIVQEAKQLDALCIHRIDHPAENQVYIPCSLMAFVTSDRELNYRLQTQISKRNFIPDDFKTECTPLFCDSTRFLELLKKSNVESAWTSNLEQEVIYESFQNANETITNFYHAQRRRYNPRRETTWERVVFAETFRQCLFDADSKVVSKTSHCPMPNDTDSSFAATYLADLSSRGYSTASIFDGVLNDRNDNNPRELSPFHGPSRLDKQQRRSLDRYNAFRKIQKN